MKLLNIFRFEFAQQLRTLSTWLYFLVLLAGSFLFIAANYADDARNGYVLVNAPVVIGAVTVLTCCLWLLVGASVAGHAATRDVQTRMHALTYTTPVNKAQYLGGKFLAALLTNMIILLALPAGMLLAIYFDGADAEITGPFRLATYLAAYFFIALPNVFFATAIQFSLAAVKRNVMASFVAGGLLFFMAYVLGSFLNRSTESLGWGNLVDPMAFSAMINKLTVEFTPAQINSFVISLEGPLLWNRMVWLGISLLALAYTHYRFRFAHPTPGIAWWKRRNENKRIQNPVLTEVNIGVVDTTAITVKAATQSFELATQMQQMLAIATVSFKQLAKNRAGLIFLLLIALLALLILPLQMEFLDVPKIPRTSHLLTYMTAPLTDIKTPWIIIPLLILFYTGELVWREREAGMSEISGASPVPEWVVFTGKFLGLVLILIVWLALLMLAGILTQVRLGYYHFEVGQYIQTLFGMQLTDYLLFAILAFVVHVLVNQKYIGHLVILIVYGYMAFAPTLGIENKLLIYGADTGWSYSNMNGFGTSLQPWFWFKLYWAAWALLLAVLARLLWVRSKETGIRSRLQLAKGRFQGFTKWAGACFLCLVLAVGSFIFYNAHVLNDYVSGQESVIQSLSYEKQFGEFERMPQPRVIGTKLNVELYPKENKAIIHGRYLLSNSSPVPIDSILVSTVGDVSTQEIFFDRKAKRIATEENPADQVYVLAQALQPGDSLQFSFKLHYKKKGFTYAGAASYVVTNGSYFTNRHLLPAIGFQVYRCSNDAGLRKKHGLAARPKLPSLYNVEVRNNLYATDQTSFDAIVSTDTDQVGVAPGKLQRTWTKDNRRYFHYVSNAPIPNQYAISSARYAVKKLKWNNVSIQVFHHPGHDANISSILAGARSALEHYSNEFAPYPYDIFKLVEHPGDASGMHAEAGSIDYWESFSLLNPTDSNKYDLPFYIVAHEVAHQWWGAAQLLPARVEGAITLTETVAVFTGMQVLEKNYGNEHLQRYLTQIRKTYEIPRTKGAVPLLRATDQYHGYRKGPFALYALSHYIGREKVNGALKQLLLKHGGGKPPLPTTLDLYRELKTVTPDTFQYLLHDLFEVNASWDLKTNQVTAQQASNGSWQVTLEVDASKAVVDETGKETGIPMNEWIEIGVFGAPEKEQGLDKILYLQHHRIRTGIQTITLIVPNKPTTAGIDPNNLLIDVKPHDNRRKIR